MLIAEILTQLAAELVKAMERREKQLLENDAIQASIYLDPRFLPFLLKENHTTAIAKLENVWVKLQALDGKGSASEIVTSLSVIASCLVDASSEEKTSSSAPNDILQRSWAKLMASKKKEPVATYSLRRQLEDFEQTETLEPSQDILQYWETKKYVMPQLYQLATVVHAAPATQVSVERLFSGMSYILSNLRTNMKSQTLDNVMVVRCNEQNTKRKLIDGKKPKAKRQKLQHESETLPLTPLPIITPADRGQTSQESTPDDSPVLRSSSRTIIKENVIPFNRF